MGHNVQVVWEKFARYFDVEPRYVPLTEERYVLGVEEALQLVDENTIGVVGVLGSTYTGEYEPIRELNDALMELNRDTGWEIPVHVDAASGGFVAPFAQPDLVWDFRLPLVKSINVSGHKYGLVYPGVGWAIWRDHAELPEELIFHVNYLGGDQPTFNLNFSKGAGQVVAQYYNFLRLGEEGYRAIVAGLYETEQFVRQAIQKLEHFDLVGKPNGLPVVCVRLRPHVPYTVFEVSARLRESGWIVPAYTLAPNAEDITVLRVVVREGMSRDMAEMLIADLTRVVASLPSSLSCCCCGCASRSITRCWPKPWMRRWAAWEPVRTVAGWCRAWLSAPAAESLSVPRLKPGPAVSPGGSASCGHRRRSAILRPVRRAPNPRQRFLRLVRSAGGVPHASQLSDGYAPTDSRGAAVQGWPYAAVVDPRRRPVWCHGYPGPAGAPSGVGPKCASYVSAHLQAASARLSPSQLR